MGDSEEEDGEGGIDDGGIIGSGPESEIFVGDSVSKDIDISNGSLKISNSRGIGGIVTSWCGLGSNLPFLMCSKVVTYCKDSSLMP